MELFFLGIASTIVAIATIAVLFYRIKFRPLFQAAKKEMNNLAAPPLPTQTTQYELRLQCLDENAAIYLARSRGRVIFLNFWGTWCAPCRAEMPNIQRLYDALKDNGNIDFYCVALHDEVATVKKFLGDKGHTFPGYLVDGEVPQEFRAQAVPRTYVITAEGNIVFQHIGATRWDAPEFIDYMKSLSIKIS